MIPICSVKKKGVRMATKVDALCLCFAVMMAAKKGYATSMLLRVVRMPIKDLAIKFVQIVALKSRERSTAYSS